MREEIVYQKGMTDDQFEALRKAYYYPDDDGDDDDVITESPIRPYEIVAYNYGEPHLNISNLADFPEERSEVSIWGNDRMIVLFALADMLGYDLKKKEDDDA